MLDYYEEREKLDPKRVLHWKLSVLSAAWNTPTPLAQVTLPQELAVYVNRIQHWLHSCRGGWYLSCHFLRSYYAALADFIRHSNPSHLKEGTIIYCQKQLVAAEIVLRDEQGGNRPDRDRLTEAGDLLEKAAQGTHQRQIDWLIRKLDEHVRRIVVAEHEYSRVAEYLSCVFISLLEDGVIHSKQEELNKARETLLPLLDLSRFEERYVL